MKTKALGLLAALSLAAAPALAQEHHTDGPVWVLSCYQFMDGQYDNYMNWLRAHNLPLAEARKKAGLILDYKMFLTNREGPNDCDVTFAELYPTAAKAFDYSAADDAKEDELSKAHWAQWDEATANKTRDSRFAMRRFISNSWAREITLKPAAK